MPRNSKLPSLAAVCLLLGASMLGGDARRDFTIEDPDGNRVVFGSEVSR
ncbi:MAG: hypothetical protein JNK45_03400 [Myxococcales bacterium]|nr:hypothetical protein [Myxococcales bacterium]